MNNELGECLLTLLLIFGFGLLPVIPCALDWHFRMKKIKGAKTNEEKVRLIKEWEEDAGCDAGDSI